MKAIMHIGNTMFEIDVKRVDLSLDGVFVKISDKLGNEDRGGFGSTGV